MIERKNVERIMSDSPKINYLPRATRTRLIVLGIVLWVAFTLSQTPAIWGASLLAKNGQLGFSGVSGTLWSGSASMASVKLNNIDYPLGKLTWTLNPWSLLTLSPCIDFKTSLERQQITGNACVSTNNSLTLRDTDLSVPINIFNKALPIPLDGNISAHINGLTLKDQLTQELEGSISWTQAKVFNGKHWMNVGGFAAKLAADGEGGLKADVFQLEGPTTTELTVHFVAAGGGSAKGRLALTEAFLTESQAEGWLMMFAQHNNTTSDGTKHYTVDTHF